MRVHREEVRACMHREEGARTYASPVPTIFYFLCIWCGAVWQERLRTGMTFSLAFADLDAAAPRQRARCAATGRFVAWSKVPQLRAAGAPRVIVITAPVVVAADAPEVAPVVEAAPVAIADGAEALSAEAPPVVAGASISGARAAGAALASLAGRAARWARAAGRRWARRAVVAAVVLAHPEVAPVTGAGAVAQTAPHVRACTM